MAKLVLAGRADCPQYAKAELLADYLQANLPDVRVHKVVQHPGRWEQWLRDVCEMNGWEHKWSPIIWRELLDRGGKGLLLGGLSEFLEYAQHYYGITSIMLTEEVLDIAEENLQAHMESEKEQEEIRSLINPLQIWITSASAATCYQLIPLLASGDVFGMTTEISIHLLDAAPFKERLSGVKDVIVWGNITGCTYIDLSHAKLYRCDSAIWGPANFSRPLLNLIYDSKWINPEFISAQSSLGSHVCHCAGMLSAHAVATALRYWFHGSPPGEIVSMGIFSEGQFCIPEGIVFSMPVRFQNGSWEVVTELEINETTREVLGRLSRDLIQEKRIALKEIHEMHPC
ncbi:putative malate dehydrogenase 1B isoform X5 [Numida meleagris]|uniref:putative malate dehydrogenase 1B isoform X5 n=1 Tax=Numida meleagris TaxID=8996 RepID=UPI000B3DEC50|nr:putative malate dehydrogenase 1B isoform X5 [Numida meleagris]